ncbi:MAG: hypothetical protein Aurels2KO_35400 [Aureliella sp.]
MLATRRVCVGCLAEVQSKMRKSSLLAALALAIISQTGCSICAPGYIDDYGAVGGKWERVNPTHGRVGSILSDSGTTVGSSDEVYYDDSYSDVVEEGEVYYDDAAIYDAMPDEIAPGSPSDGGVIILGDQW